MADNFAENIIKMIAAEMHFFGRDDCRPREVREVLFFFGRAREDSG
jgi:hypothetical protein